MSLIGLVVLATGLIMAGVVTFVMGYDAKMERRAVA
jgi:hypothetical protein